MGSLMMFFYRLYVLFVLLFGTYNVLGRKHPVTNRLTCQNVFTAYNSDSLDECAYQWSSSPWIEYSEDSTFYCKLCRTTASLPWNEKTFPYLCNLWPDYSECRRVFTSLSRLVYSKNRDITLCNVLTMCNSHGYVRDLDFGSDLCSDCQQIVKDVKRLIEDNATSDQITQTLNKYICENLPGGVKDYCENMVKVHIPAILHCFDTQIDPWAICSIIGLCRKQPYNTILKDFMIESTTKPKCSGECPKQTSYSWISRPPTPNNHMWTSKISTGVPSCDACKDVFTQVQTVLQDPKMQSQIKQVIDEKICANMGFLKHECTTLVNNNFDQILSSLLTLNPEEACAIFKMCAEIEHPLIAHKPVNIPIPGVCKFCEVIVRKLFDMLAANQTEKSLYAGMKAMCDLLPPRYKTECIDFVNKYGVQIVKAIVEGTAPALICASFGLCSEPPVPKLSVIAPALGVGDMCTPCKFAVETIYIQLRNNKTEEEIRTALNQVCGLLPAQYTDQCKEYVNAYLDIVIQYMEHNLTPEQVCQLLKLCPDSKTETLSERNPCLLGPDYWCSNYVTAKRCGATHYCQNYHRRTYRYSGQNPVSNNRPQALCQYMNLSSICVNFDLAKLCGRVQDCVTLKLKYYLDAIVEPFRPLENCSVCEQIAIRWRLQARILGGAIVNASSCSTYTGTKKRQCELVYKNHGQILNAIRLEKEEPEQICARTIGCKPKPTPQTPTNKVEDTDNVYRDAFYDKWFSRSLGRRPSKLYPTQSLHSTDEILNYFESLDQIIKGITSAPTPAPIPLDFVKRPLVGEDPCTWGPSFWCLSYKNAQKCPKALEHCQTKVWTNGIPPDMESMPSQTTKLPEFASGQVHIIRCCKSAYAARHCGPEALKFCMQHVWSNTGKNMAN